MEKPFFSIIVPCWNVAEYLDECLDSIAGQQFAEWECILGVEASTDSTERISRDREARDPRFRVFTGPQSGGCSAVRNRGVAMAKGEYVVFVDGDDAIADGSLMAIRDAIAKRPGADLYPCAVRVKTRLRGKKNICATTIRRISRENRRGRKPCSRRSSIMKRRTA